MKIKEKFFYSFSECKYYKFKQLFHLTNEDLSVVERLMICGQGQPKYNDIGRIIYNLNKIFERVKEGKVNG